MKQEQQPAERGVRHVAPGVLRVQLPIRLTGLGHVNAYVLEDGQGAAVIDPGLPGPSSWRALRRGLAEAGVPLRRVHTVIVTHSHPDHYGGVRRLAAKSGAEVVTQRDFRAWWVRPPASVLAEGTNQPQPAGSLPWQGPADRNSFRSRVRGWGMRSMVVGAMAPIPRPTRPLSDRDLLKLSGRDWQAVHTPGHTLDHLCLYDPEEGTLVSGDHVLPTITPHVAGVGGGHDPLASFLASLERVNRLPGVRRVLPAHGDPFDDLAGRIEEIKRHHTARLQRLQEASRGLGATTVVALSREIFPARLWGFMAESETYSHLEHLRCSGRMERLERDGRVLYRLRNP